MAQIAPMMIVFKAPPFDGQHRAAPTRPGCDVASRRCPDTAARPVAAGSKDRAAVPPARRSTYLRQLSELATYRGRAPSALGWDIPTPQNAAKQSRRPNLADATERTPGLS